jgi:hypothetical protein
VGVGGILGGLVPLGITIYAFHTAARLADRASQNGWQYEGIGKPFAISVLVGAATSVSVIAWVVAGLVV